MIATHIRPNENTTASGGTIPRLSLPAARPVTSVAGLGARGRIVESALRFMGYTVQRHPSGYRAIVREGAK